jgi:DNA polymerase-1
VSLLYFGPQTQSESLFFDQIVDNPPPVIAIDTETISLKERIPVGFTVSVSPEESWWIRTFPEPDAEFQYFKKVLTDPSILKVYQNAPFDLKVMNIACTDWEPDTSNIWDTNVASRLIGYTETSLVAMAPHINRTAENAGEVLKSHGTSKMTDLPEEVTAAKCANDSQVTLALYHFLKPQLEAMGQQMLDNFSVDMQVIPILVDMSERGLEIVKEDLMVEHDRLEAEVARYRDICSEYDFIPSSPAQVGYVLAQRGNRMRMKRIKDKKTGKWLSKYVTDEEALQFLDDPLAAVVLNFREMNTLLTRYVRPFLDQDYMYTDYSLDTVVGRTTSSGKNMTGYTNLQNWPPDMRYILKPQNGVFTTGDYSQEHLRILMHFSGDRLMQAIYYEGAEGGDIHQSTANALNIIRRVAKTVNFGIPYGATASVIRDNTKIRDLQLCESFLVGWKNRYREAAQWLEEAQEYGLQHGKALPTLFGRQIPIPEEFNKRGEVNYDAMARKAVNYPILGSDGEVMKRALILCEKKGLPLRVQVHDSITCDGDVQFPIEELESIPPGLRIPFAVKQSARWE